MSRRARLGVLGGTFDPIHRGHLALARAVRDRLGLDRVLLVPSARPPHKRGRRDLTPAEDRLALVEAAVKDERGLVASDVELRREGPSYTVDTLAALARENPGAELVFILGSDSLPELASWREPERILELARLVVVNRPGHDLARGLDTVAEALGPAAARALRENVVEIEPEAVSSTAIRARARKGEPLDGLVPDAVRDLIAARGLYRERGKTGRRVSPRGST